MTKRLPALADILPVFAIIAFLFYGWTMMVFLWKASGWLFFLTPGEIAVIFAYQLATNLAESLFFLLILLVLAAVLPARLLKEVFIVRGGAISVTAIGSMMLFLHLTASTRPGPSSSWFGWMLVTLLLAILSAWAATRFQWIGRALAGLGDRLIVFLFLLAPLSLIALVTVLLRLFFL